MVGRRGEDNASIRNAPSCPRENSVFRNPAQSVMLRNNPDWNLSNVPDPRSLRRSRIFCRVWKLFPRERRDVPSCRVYPLEG